MARAGVGRRERRGSNRATAVVGTEHTEVMLFGNFLLLALTFCAKLKMVIM